MQNESLSFCITNLLVLTKPYWVISDRSFSKSYLNSATTKEI